MHQGPTRRQIHSGKTTPVLKLRPISLFFHVQEMLFSAKISYCLQVKPK